MRKKAWTENRQKENPEFFSEKRPRLQGVFTTPLPRELFRFFLCKTACHRLCVRCGLE